jgi:hypothetical protein
VERLHPEPIARIDVHLGAGFEQDPGRFGLAEEGRQVERREAIARELRDPGRILRQALAEPLRVAERRGLEHVQVRVGGQ